MNLLKVSLVGVSLWFIYVEIISKENLGGTLETIRNRLSSSASLILILLVAVLMVANWSLEAWKWMRIIKPVEEVNFMKAVRAVLSGLTVSFFLPNRIGEFAGRIMHLKRSSRIAGILANVVASFAQLLPTIIFGLAGIMAVFRHFSDAGRSTHSALITLTAISSFFLVWMYYRVARLSSASMRIKFLQRYKKYSDVFSRYSFHDLSMVLGLSVARYAVFIIQFLLLMNVFSVDVPALYAASLFPFVLLVLTFIPNSELTEIAVRSSVSVFVFGKFTENIAGVLSASVALWFINLVLPAVIGSVTIFYMRITK